MRYHERIENYTSFKLIKEIKANTTESRKEWMMFLFAKAGKENSNNTNYQFWRQDNHPIALDFTSNIFEQKLDYIHNNPVVAGIVEKPEDYIYSSARDDQEIKGLIEIDVLQ